MAGKARNITGIKFGTLTAVEIVGRHPKLGALWRCLCDCGGKRNVYATRLIHKAVQMCEDCQQESYSYVKGWERQIPKLTPEARALYRELINRRVRAGIAITSQIGWEAFDVARREFPRAA